MEDVRKKLQEINEYIKKEHKSLKFQYRIRQRDVLKWVLEEWPRKRRMYSAYA